jgi:hypothetical protein
MLVVNYFGGPCASKSSSALLLSGKLKFSRVRAEFVDEYAKKLTWEERHNILREDQLYIFAKQRRQLAHLVGTGIEVAVTDSPILLSRVYASFYGQDVPPEFGACVNYYHRQFDNLNIYLHRTKPYDPVGRGQSEEEARAIDAHTYAMLTREGHDFIELPGTEESVETVRQIIFHRLTAQTA